MASRKRKRKQAGIHQRLRNHNGEPQKRIKLRDGKSSVPLRHDLPAAHSRIVEGIRHEVLSLYHARLLPLRAYLLSALPAGSKRRRRLLLALGTRSHSLQFGNPSTPSSGDGAPQNSELGYLLDSTLVSMRTQEMPSDTRGRLEELSAFSQKHNDTSLESVDGVRGDQADIVDFAIRQLFDRESGKHASHLLCYGYECAMGGSKEAHGRVGTTTVPGLTSRFPNPSVDNLKGPHWVEILRTLGSEGERVMLNLLLDCSIFCGVGSGHGNYYQLSGMPLPRLKPLADARLSDDLNGPPKPHHVVRSGSITFSRNRMLYATAAFDGVGHVRHGLPLIHVLNKYSDDTNLDHTHHVMKYIFPHQYGLQSVLMPPVNTQQPIKWYKDYTSREQEIAQADRVADLKAKNPATTHGKTSRLPRRLRGKLPDLITKLRKLHALCPYVALLDHFCPIGNQHVVRDEQSIDSATTSANVSAFVRAVISRVVPHELWGTGPEGVENERLIMRSVDRFVVLRRFEGLTLHEVLQGLKINSIAWLRPVRTEALANLSSSDTQKRLEIFSEFVHYLFDSLLIPLIRANFHVTESNIHRNRIFFFRQDLWQSLTRSTMATLTRTMLQAHDGEMSQAKLAHRRLGYSHIRLLPKAVGLRPIMNLSKRAITMRGAKKHLEPSINSTLTPLFNVLNFERKCQPAAMGSSMLSVGDLYSRLSSYREGLQRAGKRRDDFYFVKVDVRSCFDTIPQHRVVELLKGVMSEVEYRIDRHVVVKVAEASAGSTTVRPARRFATVAKAPNDFTPFADSLEDDLAVGRKASVFVGGMPSRFWKQRDLLELLAEHVQANLVKIGKSYYRQKEGIPQGSVLSSLLCNFVYGQLEAEKLQFLREDDSLLLRLIDDFLLITTSREDAGRFLGIMQAGLPDYGVAINPSKTLTNFHGPHDRSESVRLNQGDRFPYCGNFINTRTLEISKDRARKAGGAVSDSLTVEYSNMPGKTFHRKVLNMFKLQSHAMFLDTSYNSTTTVLANIHQAFIECAMKFHRYIKCLSSRKRPGTVLLSNTIDDLVDLAYVLMKSQRKREKFPSYQCAVTKAEVKWLAATAFQQVLSRKQSVYRDLLARLTSLATAERPKTRKACRRLEKVARASTMAFGPLQY